MQRGTRPNNGYEYILTRIAQVLAKDFRPEARIDIQQKPQGDNIERKMVAYIKLPSPSFPIRLTVCGLSRLPPISAFASQLIDPSTFKELRFAVALEALQIGPRWEKNQVMLSSQTWPQLMVLVSGKIKCEKVLDS